MGDQIGSGTALGLLQFLDQLVEKGRAMQGSIKPMKSVIRQVMPIVEGRDTWQDVDVRTVDIDDYIERFSTLTIGKYDHKSLMTYRSRLRRSIDWYTTFLVQPGWSPPKIGKDRTPVAKKVRSSENMSVLDIKTLTKETDESTGLAAGPTKQTNDLIAYPFPLRPGRMVHLYLPLDLTTGEARRLSKFLESLSIDES